MIRNIYLGAWFGESGKSASAVAPHETATEAIINKLAIFCSNNTQMPFIYKRTVFEAAVMSF